MAVTNPSVSVVICTRNRPDVIRQAVESVLANDYPSFDVSVIDQSTTDATQQTLSSITDPRLTYLRVAEPGLSRAYNTGIRRSDGEVLAFTDDDCVAPTDWLRTIVGRFRADPEADLLFGQVLPPPEYAGRPGVTPYLVIGRPARVHRNGRAYGYKVLGGMGANFAARRRLFERIGAFDEILGGGAPLRSSQDFDHTYRAFTAGAVILFRPDVRVVHYSVRVGDEWRSTLRAYGIGDGAFYWKHVRCGDVFALGLLLRRLINRGSRESAKRLLGRGGDLTYVRSILQGVRESFRFPVDRQTRLYQQP